MSQRPFIVLAYAIALIIALAGVALAQAENNDPTQAEVEQNSDDPTHPDFGVSRSGVTRVPGDTRIHTTALVATLRFPHGGYIDQVIVANGWALPDALAASMWTYSRPLLLVTKNGVPAPTRNALRRFEPESIVVLGGEGVVSDRVLRRLDDFIVE